MTSLKRHLWVYWLWTILSAADIFGLRCAWAEIIVGDVPLGENPHIFLGRPESQTDTGIMISRTQYVIRWDYEKRIPEWIAWSVSLHTLGAVDRASSFRRDQDLDRVLREQSRNAIGPKDYSNSCMDRGHQVPSADRTSTRVDNESTFLMSNVMPQTAFLNRGAWFGLERFVRQWVVETHNRVQIYAGYVADPKMRTIGGDARIHVPTANFKIVVLIPSVEGHSGKSDLRFFVVNFPNVTSRGTNPVDDYLQACRDSEQNAGHDQRSPKSAWRPYLSRLSAVEESSRLSFDFLAGFHEMTPAEVDEMLAAHL